jgi:hypothetical protein
MDSTHEYNVRRPALEYIGIMTHIESICSFWADGEEDCEIVREVVRNAMEEKASDLNGIVAHIERVATYSPYLPSSVVAIIESKDHAFRFLVLLNKKTHAKICIFPEKLDNDYRDFAIRYCSYGEFWQEFAIVLRPALLKRFPNVKTVEDHDCCYTIDDYKRMTTTMTEDRQ